MTDISASLLWDIFKHLSSWLRNLSRAGDKRKTESIRALRDIITASRETAVYIRQLNETAKSNHKIESHLSVLWTELGFALEDLGIATLAKRCQIKGKQWASPDHYDTEFITKADISLEKMERLAKEILYKINQS
ncbi:MAG: hypothetical protein COB23_04435 [Methylophaga sp.]|nr:MAG: hypothetical protein COB23_04435 [Methylophaga sp.]